MTGCTNLGMSIFVVFVGLLDDADAGIAALLDDAAALASSGFDEICIVCTAFEYIDLKNCCAWSIVTLFACSSSNCVLLVFSACDL
jgi:hypothetical protein